jgi:hypothetical protein
MNLDHVTDYEDYSMPPLFPRVVKTVRVAYRISTRSRLDTERLYAIASVAGWPLFVPAWGEAAPDWLSQTTLTADTHTGEVIFRKKAGAKYWTSFERGLRDNEGAVAQLLQECGIDFKLDVERCTSYH